MRTISKPNTIETLELGLRSGISTLVLVCLKAPKENPGTLNVFKTSKVKGGGYNYTVGVRYLTDLTKSVKVVNGEKKYSESTLCGLADGVRLELRGEYWGTLTINSRQYGALLSLVAENDNPIIGVERSNYFVKGYIHPESSQVLLSMSIYDQGLEVIRHITS